MAIVRGALGPLLLPCSVPECMRLASPRLTRALLPCSSPQHAISYVRCRGGKLVLKAAFRGQNALFQYF